MAVKVVKALPKYWVASCVEVTVLEMIAAADPMDTVPICTLLDHFAFQV